MLPVRRAVGALALTFLLLLFFSASFYAATARPQRVTHYVNPDGKCGGKIPCYPTVHEAVEAAGTGHIIQIAPAVYSESLRIDKALTLRGAGPISTVLDGGHAVQVLRVISGPVHIRDLTVQNGQAEFQMGGAGGIVNESTLILDNVTVRYNRGFEPGGISNSGVMTIANSAVYSNTARQRGGGIWNVGQMWIESSVISDNASSIAGGIIASSGALTIEDSIIRANRTDHQGGGLFVGNSRVYIVNTTFAENTAGESGGVAVWYDKRPSQFIGVTFAHNRAMTQTGGLHVRSSAPITIVNSTFSGNQAPQIGGLALVATSATISNSTVVSNEGRLGGGLAVITGAVMMTVALHNTVVAGNVDPEGVDPGAAAPDCSGPVVSLGYNFVGNSAGCDLLATVGDQMGTALTPLDPMLGPLAEQPAGPPVHVPLEGSPLIDAGDPARCPATDQRGLARPLDGDGDGDARCDVGAVEFVLERRLYLPLLVNPASEP